MKCFLCLQNNKDELMFQLLNKDCKGQQQIKNLHYFCSQFFKELILYQNDEPYFLGFVENKNCIEDCIICNRASVGAYMIKCNQKNCDQTYHIQCIRGRIDINFQQENNLEKYQIFCKKHQCSIYFYIESQMINAQELENRSQLFIQNMQLQKEIIENEQKLFYESINDNMELIDNKILNQKEIEQNDQQESQETLTYKSDSKITINFVKKEVQKKNYFQPSSLQKAIQLKIKKQEGGKTQRIRQFRKPNFQENEKNYNIIQLKEKSEIEKSLIKGQNIDLIRDMNNFWNYLDTQFFQNQLEDQIKDLIYKSSKEEIQIKQNQKYQDNIQFKQRHLLTVYIEGNQKENIYQDTEQTYYKLQYKINFQNSIVQQKNTQKEQISLYNDNDQLNVYLSYMNEFIQNKNVKYSQSLQNLNEYKNQNSLLQLQSCEQLSKKQFLNSIRYQIDFNDLLQNNEQQNLSKNFNEIQCEIEQLQFNLKQQYFEKFQIQIKQLIYKQQIEKKKRKYINDLQNICNLKMDQTKFKKIQKKIKIGFTEEKPDYQQNQFIQYTGQNMFIETDCNICFHTFFEENDPVVYCSKCKISLHQNCYGIQKIPENDYFCDICEIGRKKNRNLYCILCKKQDFPLKRIENAWIHIQCLILMNITYQQDNNFKIIKQIQMNDLIFFINQNENQNQCYICKSKQGHMIKCQECDEKMHYLCAYLEGFEFEIKDSFKQQNLITNVFCDLHKNIHKQKFLRRFQINYEQISQKYKNYDDYCQKQAEIQQENQIQKQIKL